MPNEYESLREELLQWQSRRFVIISTCVAIVTSVLGLTQTIGNIVPWYCISAILLIFLSVACYLTAYCGIANQKIGAYIQVFYENSSLGWESRNSKFKEAYKEISRNNIGNLNKNLSIIYLCLGIISCTIPPLTFKAPQEQYWSYMFLFLIIILYLLILKYLYSSQGKRDDYIKSWQKIKENE